MANFEGVDPISGGNFRTAGITQLNLSEWSIQEKNNKKSLELVFADGDYVKKTWIPFKSAFADNKQQLGFFLGKLKQYTNILAAYIGEEEALKLFAELNEGLKKVNFNPQEIEEVQKVEEDFVVALFKGLPANYQDTPIDVIMAYGAPKDGKQYLNIASYGDNEFQLPVGVNLKVSSKLRMERDEVESEVEVPTEVVPTEVAESPVVDSDLPF